MADVQNEVVVAIRDLTRVIIATSERFESKADAIRQLEKMGIAPARIGRILDIPTKHVTSVISRAKKKDNNG